jgi:hypothetical protein
MTRNDGDFACFTCGARLVVSSYRKAGPLTLRDQTPPAPSNSRNYKPPSREIPIAWLPLGYVCACGYIHGDPRLHHCAPRELRAERQRHIGYGAIGRSAA